MARDVYDPVSGRWYPAPQNWGSQQQDIWQTGQPPIPRPQQGKPLIGVPSRLPGAAHAAFSPVAADVPPGWTPGQRPANVADAAPQGHAHQPGDEHPEDGIMPAPRFHNKTGRKTAGWNPFYTGGVNLGGLLNTAMGQMAQQNFRNQRASLDVRRTNAPIRIARIQAEAAVERARIQAQALASALGVGGGQHLAGEHQRTKPQKFKGFFATNTDNAGEPIQSTSFINNAIKYLIPQPTNRLG